MGAKKTSTTNLTNQTPPPCYTANPSSVQSSQGAVRGGAHVVCGTFGVGFSIEVRDK